MLLSIELLPAPSGVSSRARRGRRLPWAWITGCALLGLVLLGLPLHVRMGIWPDVVFFDLCAKNMLRGGTLYRDIFLHGLSGIIFSFAAVRSLLGWSFEAIRLVDFALVLAIVCLLAFGPLAPARAATERLALTTILVLFYFATSEWSHCQPDTWMMMPALLALTLRSRRLQTAGIATPALLAAILEGILWGVAFLFKPMAIVPAAAAWLISAIIVWKSHTPPATWQRLFPLWDLAATVTGGLIVGAATVFWLKVSGNWPYFVEAAIRWNGEYLTQQSKPLLERLVNMLGAFRPWSWLHPVAILAALWIMVEACRKRAAIGPALLASCYLGWLLEANLLQRQFDYQLAPTILLALAVLAACVEIWRHPVIQILVLPVLLAGVITQHPLAEWRRVVLWPRCWHESSIELRDLLSLELNQRVSICYRELARAEDYLRGQHVKDREVTCYAISALSLYMDMDLEPSNRFILLGVSTVFFPSHHEEMRQALIASPQRFVVSDIHDLSPINPVVKMFPWSEPIVFTAGRYQVRKVTTDKQGRPSVGELIGPRADRLHGRPAPRGQPGGAASAGGSLPECDRALPEVLLPIA